MSETTTNTYPSTRAQVTRSLCLLINFITPFVANMYLPSLPAMGHQLGVSDEKMEFTITFFILGFALSQLIYGPLSDRFGRRKILFIGFCIALLGSLGCAMANSANEIIIARFILGMGMGAGAVLTRAIMRDTFNGATLVKVVAQNSVIFSFAPVLAPLVGAYIGQWFGWEGNFIVLTAVIALTWLLIWKFLAETHPERDSTSFHPYQVIKNYITVMKNRYFQGYIICAIATVSGFNAYITMSPFLFVEKLHVSAVEYGWFMGIIISGAIVGRVLNSILLSFWSSKQMLFCGGSLILLAGLLLLIPGMFNIINIPLVLIPLIIFIIADGIVGTTAYAHSLQPFHHNSGVAGAVYGALTLLIAFVVSAIVAIVDTNNQTLLGFIYVVLSFAILFTFKLRKEEQTEKIKDEKYEDLSRSQGSRPITG